jgi:hypothetical protein
MAKAIEATGMQIHFMMEKRYRLAVGEFDNILSSQAFECVLNLNNFYKG